MALQDKIDILAPPIFEPTGRVKTIERAIQDGDWMGGIHVWLYIRSPEPAVILQLRSKQKRIAPNMLDVAVAGHYEAGEQGLDGLREAREELGVDIQLEHCELWGKRLFADVDNQGKERKFAMTTYIAEFVGTLADITPQPEELEGVFIVPLKPLLQVLYGNEPELVVQGIDGQRQPATYTVLKDAFYHNPDNYHLHLLEYIAFKLGVTL